MVHRFSCFRLWCAVLGFGVLRGSSCSLGTVFWGGSAALRNVLLVSWSCHPITSCGTSPLRGWTAKPAVRLPVRKALCEFNWGLHSMSKVKIAEYPNKGEPDYSHLNKLVEFLLESGNKPKHEYLWGVNRTGYFCHLTKDIDFNAVQTHFDIPPSIQLCEPEQRISCMNTYSNIKVVR